MPARFRDIKRAGARVGITFEKPSSGSHWKTRSETGGMYPIPAPNGERTEISDHYIRGMCRAHGVDYDEMKRLLAD
jgi:hypothetical protein